MHRLQTQGCLLPAAEAAVGYLTMKRQLVATYDPGWLQRSTNDGARVSGALLDDTNKASERGVREGCVVPSNSPQESPYISMAMRLCEAAEPTNTPTNATHATPTQPGFAQPQSHLRPAFPACWWVPSGTDHAAQPTRHQQPPTARAPAGRHSPTMSRGFSTATDARQARQQKAPSGSQVSHGA